MDPWKTFQPMMVSPKKNGSKSVLNVICKELTMESCVKLLGIEIDNKLKFEKHISNICKKASSHLITICRLQTFMGHKEKEAMINTFVHSDFSYGFLTWHFGSKMSQNKVEKNHEKRLKFLSNDYVKQLCRTSQTISISINGGQKTL